MDRTKIYNLERKGGRLVSPFSLSSLLSSPTPPSSDSAPSSSTTPPGNEYFAVLLISLVLVAFPILILFFLLLVSLFILVYFFAGIFPHLHPPIKTTTKMSQLIHPPTPIPLILLFHYEGLILPSHILHLHLQLLQVQNFSVTVSGTDAGTGNPTVTDGKGYHQFQYYIGSVDKTTYLLPPPPCFYCLCHHHHFVAPPIKWYLHGDVVAGIYWVNADPHQGL